VSAISSYAKALAVAAGRAIPIATRRHVYISDRPLVLVPLALAGEANAPLAAMIGTDLEGPTVLVVPQPRNRDLRFAFAASLADIVLDYVRSCAGRSEIIGNDPHSCWFPMRAMLPSSSCSAGPLVSVAQLGRTQYHREFRCWVAG
jgi:hypothetical protein